MKQLTAEQVQMLHTQLVAATGGTDGLRDGGLLSSAVAAPFQTFGGEMLCSTLEAQAARLGYGLIKDHPFLDGNKRIGVHTMLVFLAVNGVRLVYTQAELSEIVLRVAASETDDRGLLDWICSHRT